MLPFSPCSHLSLTELIQLGIKSLTHMPQRPRQKITLQKSHCPQYSVVRQAKHSPQVRLDLLRSLCQ